MENAINNAAFWQDYDFTISPYVHSGQWEIGSNGYDYSDSVNSIHASYVETFSGENFASMVQENNVFGIRSTHELFDCFEAETQGFNLRLVVSQMQNCIIEVLTWLDTSQNNNFNYALEDAGVVQNGTDWVWEKK